MERGNRAARTAEFESFSDSCRAEFSAIDFARQKEAVSSRTVAEQGRSLLPVAGRRPAHEEANIWRRKMLYCGVQRDMDLIRQILSKIEDHSGGFAPRNFEIEGDYSAAQIGYHVWLLGDAGLIKATDVTTHGSESPRAIPVNLTWEGHDFIAAARNDTVWSHAKEKAKSVGGSLSFAVFKQLLDSLVKHQLGI